MIWIFENLSDAEKAALARLDPLVDFEYSRDKSMYYWQTYHAITEQMRYVRFFEVKQAKQGFICDDFEEAKWLSMYIRREIARENFKRFVPQHRMVQRHLDLCNPLDVRIIAIPVRELCRYFAIVDAERTAGILSQSDLDKWGIDLAEFDPEGPLTLESPTAAQDCYRELTPEGVGATIQILKTMLKHVDLPPEQGHRINCAIEALGWFPNAWPPSGFGGIRTDTIIKRVELEISSDRLYIEVGASRHEEPFFEFHFARTGTFFMTKDTLKEYVKFASDYREDQFMDIEVS